ncbi:hypothetical protein [Tropicibacter alexandrii]|uniref:hypothetical protein n=1 Tax=Tropicibacter alexandrii TaxID=2267683 RepID=UPI000EF514EE|nr:hypothetical protein [Tropicibacter alexandrii]
MTKGQSFYACCLALALLAGQGGAQNFDAPPTQEPIGQADKPPVIQPNPAVVEDSVLGINPAAEAAPEPNAVGEPVDMLRSEAEPVPAGEIEVDLNDKSAPVAESEPRSASPELAACNASNEALVAVIQDLTKDVQCLNVTELRAELGTCTGNLNDANVELRVQKKSNIRLNEALAACEDARVSEEAVAELEARLLAARADLEQVRKELDFSEVERDAAQTALAKAEAQVARLEERLTLQGITPEPDFAYAGGVSDSFVLPSDAAALVRPELRLPVDRCAEALEWLDTRKGIDRPFLTQLWVWERPDADPQVCAPRQGGGVIIKPNPREQAHVVIFR